MIARVVEQPAPGIHVGVPMEEYHSWPAWGSSALKDMRQGPPARVPWSRANPSPETKDTRRGSAVHALLLEPEVFAARFVQKPEGMEFRSAADKAWRDGHLAAGRSILTCDEWDQVHAIADAFRAKGPAHASLKGASHVEVSLVWTCPESGEPCKGRPDWIGEDGYLYDLKSSRHAGGSYLALECFKQGWMHQAAHYLAGARALGIAVKGCRLVVSDPKAPHFTRLLSIKPDALDLLHLVNVDTLKKMGACRTSGEWPGTPDAWEAVEPPSAALADVVSFTAALEE